MIQIIFDFNNGIGTYNEGELTVVRRIEIFEKSAYWQTAVLAFSTDDDRRIIACWKVWKDTKQFVELDEYDHEMYELAHWSYAGGSSEPTGGRLGYSVIVVGSKYGDWASM
jgi:hypothetical protein